MHELGSGGVGREDRSRAAQAAQDASAIRNGPCPKGNGLMREGHKPQTVTALLTSFEQHSIRIEGRRFFVRRGIALGVAHDSRARQLEAFRPAVSASWARFSDRQEKTREKARKRKRRGRGKIDRSKLSWRVSTGRNRERGD
jgi:hypothetical protein